MTAITCTNDDTWHIYIYIYVCVCVCHWLLWWCYHPATFTQGLLPWVMWYQASINDVQTDNQIFVKFGWSINSGKTPCSFRISDSTWRHQTLYVTSSYSIWIFCRGVSGFATDCPCGVWCHGLTTCLLYVCPLFGNRLLNNSWVVGLT